MQGFGGAPRPRPAPLPCRLGTPHAGHHRGHGCLRQVEPRRLARRAKACRRRNTCPAATTKSGSRAEAAAARQQHGTPAEIESGRRRSSRCRWRACWRPTVSAAMLRGGPSERPAPAGTLRRRRCGTHVAPPGHAHPPATLLPRPARTSSACMAPMSFDTNAIGGASSPNGCTRCASRPRSCGARTPRHRACTSTAGNPI